MSATADVVLPAVTLTVAKRKGSDAHQIVSNILTKLEDLDGRLIPPGVNVSVTRDYGETAKDFGTAVQAAWLGSVSCASHLALALELTTSFTATISALSGLAVQRQCDLPVQSLQEASEASSHRGAGYYPSENGSSRSRKAECLQVRVASHFVRPLAVMKRCVVKTDDRALAHPRSIVLELGDSQREL